jgi:hypothetical protein
LNSAALAALLVEAVLLAPAGTATEMKDDPLADAAKLYKVDGKALRSTVVSEREKRREATVRQLSEKKDRWQTEGGSQVVPLQTRTLPWPNLREQQSGSWPFPVCCKSLNGANLRRPCGF